MLLGSSRLRFDDRLEIISPGRLVFPVTLESLGHVRETRNRLIVRVLRQRQGAPGGCAQITLNQPVD